MPATKAKTGEGLKILICVRRDEPGFHAFCPSLPGVHTYGLTKEEAVDNVKDAIMAYLVSLAKHHEPIPGDLFYTSDTPTQSCDTDTKHSIVGNFELVPA